MNLLVGYLLDTAGYSWIVLATTIHKILETNSSFDVKQRTTGKFNFFFSAVFC